MKALEEQTLPRTLPAVVQISAVHTLMERRATGLGDVKAAVSNPAVALIIQKGWEEGPCVRARVRMMH
jgi:hypothetical protein